CAITSLYYCIYVFFVFFFQAEDGIRDRNVTGVQTCALPISSTHTIFSIWMVVALCICKFSKIDIRRRRFFNNMSKDYVRYIFHRSEERRVGKECRSGWVADR